MTPAEGYQEAVRRIAEAKQAQMGGLDLSDLGLTEIPAGLKDCDQLQSLDLSRNQLGEIKGLPVGLVSLNLRGNQLVEIKGLPASLQSLDLTFNQIQAIKNLPAGLVSLNLNSNQLGEIKGLPAGLWTLDLGENQIKVIENLPKCLQTLDLSMNLIKVIEGLPASLNALNLVGNQIELIENLPTGLHILDLGANYIAVIDGLSTELHKLGLGGNEIMAIDNLPISLQSLDLWSNKISVIERLPAGLVSLNLGNNQIQDIKGLPAGLQSLDLGENQLGEIKGLPAGLQSLDLHSNQIEGIKDLPAGLQSLNLLFNQIREIKDLPAGLQELDLSYNKIEEIKDLPAGLQSLGLSGNRLREIKDLPAGLRRLTLFGNPCRNIAPELLAGKYEYEKDCLEAVNAWFADLEVGKETNRAVRLMVTGNGNVGKSSLIDALENGRCATEHKSSHGIRITTLPFTDGQHPSTMQVFDFGGQELYSGTHQLFLRGRAVQLLVFDAGTEASELTEDRITKEPVRNQTLPSWMDTLRRSSPDSAFVLVQNKMDAPALLNFKTKAFVEQCETNGIAFVKVSATAVRNISALRGHLVDAARMLPEYGMEMPLSWHTVRQYFLDNVGPEAQQRIRLLTLDAFTEKCYTAGVLPLSIPSLLRYLHNSGAVYHDETYLGDTVIADQQWAIEAIYKVLDRESDFYYELRRISFGFVLAKTLFRQFGNEYTTQQQQLFLSLMESCGLCFPLTEERRSVDDYTYYVFPEFLPTSVPEGVAYFMKDTERPQRIFQQRLDFLPYSHVQQLIARWGIKAEIRDVWRTGFRATAPTGRFTLLADLREQTLTIHAERVILDEWLEQLLQEAAYERTEWQEITPSTAPKPVNVSPEPTNPGDLRDTVKNVPPPPIKRLVISYAEQDRRFVELLMAKLSTRKHLIDGWYDYKISAREDWDIEIMSRFADADGYVIFVSDHYMDASRKRYIHEKEIPLMRRRCGLETDQTSTGLFRMLIATTPFNTQYTPLEPFPTFEKGRKMPDPSAAYDDASQFVDDFLIQVLFPKFLNPQE